MCHESSKSCKHPSTDCLKSDDPCATDMCIESLGGCQFTCGAILDTWFNVIGVSVTNLKIVIDSGVMPNTTERLGSLLEMRDSYDYDDHGSRMIGWLVPPITGEYNFLIAADYLAELWLSTDDNPKNIVLLLDPQVAAPGPREWVYSTQKSEPISLEADHAYYFEVRAVFAHPILLATIHVLAQIITCIPEKDSRNVYPFVIHRSLCRISLLIFRLTLRWSRIEFLGLATVTCQSVGKIHGTSWR